MDPVPDGSTVHASSDGHEALGRYRTPPLMRWLYLAMATSWSLLAVANVIRHRDQFQVVPAVAWVVLAAGQWLVPAVSISTEGLRLGLRRIAWTDVAAFPERSSVDKYASIKTRAGRRIVLRGVPIRLAPALRLLAAHAGPEDAASDRRATLTDQ